MRVFKRGEIYYIDYITNGKRIRESVGENRKMALDALGKRRADIREGKYFNIKHREKIKFADFANTFLELHSKVNKRTSSYIRDIYLLKQLNPVFGDKYLHAITNQQVEEYKAYRGKKVNVATINRELCCLRTILNKAVEWNKIEKSPIKIKFFKETGRRLRFLEKEEITKLLDNCSTEYLKPIVIVALNTGMRRGEILNLKWHDIDVIRELIYLTDTKNHEKREIPMNDIVKKTLIAVPKHPNSPYIFCNKEGLPYGKVRKSFDNALKKSGIIGFRFHDLRHTFASQCVMAGIDLRTVQELLGHKDYTMTLRYAHLSQSHKKRAVDILGQKIGKSGTNMAQMPICENAEKTLVLLPVAK